jgi:hypothetical protein
MATLDSNLTSPDLGTKQGVTWDGTYFYTTDNDEIVKWDVNWVEVDRNTTPIADAGLAGTGANHCGDLTSYNGELYIPIETSPTPPWVNQWIVVYSAADLSYIRKYDISAQGRETSAIEYNAADNLLYVVDFTNTSSLMKYSLTGVYQGTLSLSSYVSSMQGLTFLDGYMYITSSTNPNNNTVNKFTLDGKWVTAIYQWNVGLANQELEGITNNGTQLIFIGYVPGNYSKAYFLDL